MNSLATSGICELSVPNLRRPEAYKHCQLLKLWQQRFLPCPLLPSVTRICEQGKIHVLSLQSGWKLTSYQALQNCSYRFCMNNWLVAEQITCCNLTIEVQIAKCSRYQRVFLINAGNTVRKRLLRLVHIGKLNSGQWRNIIINALYMNELTSTNIHILFMSFLLIQAFQNSTQFNSSNLVTCSLRAFHPHNSCDVWHGSIQRR